MESIDIIFLDLEFEDELVEITPENIRLRKKILDKSLRAKARNK